MDGSTFHPTAGVTLRRATANHTTWAAALAATVPLLEGACALGWSPDRVDLGVLGSGELHGSDGQTVTTGTWFEGRCFTDSVELRWLARPGGGRAVLVGETDLPLPAGWDALPDVECTRLDGISALLWGRAVGPSRDGWVALSTARIGTYRVPASEVANRRSVVLRSTEYITRGEHGNAVVVDERLRGFAAQPGGGPNDA